jgi:signal transduction histidine kinase
MEVVGYVLPDTPAVHQKVADVEIDKDPFMQKVFSLTEPMIVADARLEPLADQRHVEAFGLRTCIAIPMFSEAGPIGPFNVSTFDDQGVVAPTAQELEFFIQVAALVGVVITRLQVEQEKEVLESKLVATQRLEALGRLAGEVAHDFNNLLLAILGNADLALEELSNDAARPYLDDIREVTLRASGLSRQLLAFSKGQVMSSQVLPINTLVTKGLALLRRLLPSNITVEPMLSPKVGSVQGDAGQLEQVLMNLVLNARDAECEKIVVETQNVRVEEEFVANHSNVKPGRYVLLTVTDDGHGMDAETQRQVFEPFFTTKSEERGTGLGLSVVQGIVSQHGGHIHVYSEPDIGTTFKVYLPLSEQLAAGIGSGLMPKASSLRGTETVLVADDQEHVRSTIRKVLSKAGYRVLLAANAAQALALCEQHRPNAMLSDIVMPGLSGIELAEQLSSKLPSLEVLLMTGYAPNKLANVRWPHLTKPFSPTELLTALRGVLDRG